MCIRDRVITFRLGYRGAQGLWDIDPDLTTLGKIMGGGFPAVSYTHLRAHETVLDLVCRLLLEKKKQYTL